MKCQVQWIDPKTGKFTPDDNEAVMMAHFHEPIWGTPGPDNSIKGYSDKIQDSFPICAEHYARVDRHFRPPLGGWTFEPISDEAFIAYLEKRSMSSWTDEELAKYSRLTGQSEHESNCTCATCKPEAFIGHDE